MRLCKFELRNFKAIQYATIDWNDLFVLIGENNCGKSSVLAAISCFLSGSSIKDLSLFRHHQADHDNAIELIGHFDRLTSSDENEVAVRGRTYEGKWILKKRYWFEKPSEGNEERGTWKEQLYTFSSEDDFIGWPSSDGTWSAFPPEYQSLIDGIPNRPARPNMAAREALRDLVRSTRPDLVTPGEPGWDPNPGGGGNWKSNANSILPRAIFVRAVHEAGDETNARDASTYGKLVNLIVERQLSQRTELQALKDAIEGVLALFRPDDEHPERQAIEVRQLQERINQGMNEVIGGQALIRTTAVEVNNFLLPSTSLVIRDPLSRIETEVTHQGHGLQRTLIMTLLQVLVETQSQSSEPGAASAERPTVLLVEEPELYLHPQMERLMRDVLYRLAEQSGMQVACCTHSPVFLDISSQHRSIVRMVRQPDGDVASVQVTSELFTSQPPEIEERERLKTIARFHPTINELFFAKSVVLFEEFSAIAAVERAAELIGLFDRHRRLRREVTFVDCDGKLNIPAFQRVLNAFEIPYRVIHDEDRSNQQAFQVNGRIASAASANPSTRIHTVSPNDLEGILGYQIGKGSSKPFAAVRHVERLHADDALPGDFVEVVNFAYFGEVSEPSPSQ